MNKSNFCEDHFVMNCRLCSQEVAAPPVLDFNGVPQIVPFTTPVPTEKVGLPAGGDYINLSAIGISQNGLTNSEVESEEGKTVLSVTDRYARACDDLSRAKETVTAVIDHIAKMGSTLLELQEDVVSKKVLKDNLKLELLSTLEND